MSSVSTHILDTSRGVPATGIPVGLERESTPDRWTPIGMERTDADGRVKNLIPAGNTLSTGVYRLRFETGAYFKNLGVSSFHPRIEVTFEVTDASRHHHVPLLLSPFGYSTYRGT